MSNEEALSFKIGQVWEIVEPIRVWALYSAEWKVLKPGDKVIIHCGSGTPLFIDVSFWGERLWTDKYQLVGKANLIG